MKVEEILVVPWGLACGQRTDHCLEEKGLQQDRAVGRWKGRCKVSVAGAHMGRETGAAAGVGRARPRGTRYARRSISKKQQKCVNGKEGA